MSSGTVVYVPSPEPLARDRVVLFGYYDVRLPDGFHLYVPHQGFPGTVSAMPVDLDLEPEFAGMLINEAEAARERYRGVSA